MGRSWGAMFVVGAVLAVGGCSSGSDERPSATSSRCGGAVGGAGIKWLEKRISGDAGFGGDSDILSARSLYRNQVEAWDPQSKVVSAYARARVCRASSGKKAPAERFQIVFGPSIMPFNHPFVGPSRVIKKQEMVALNSSVKLVWGRLDEGAQPVYRTYVKCRIERAAPEQELEVPLQGTMTDTLPAPGSPRSHFRHLLHATRVVVDGLGCTNKPVVPLEVPAAVP